MRAPFRKEHVSRRFADCRTRSTMFWFVFVAVLAAMPAQHHSLGLDFSSLIDPRNSTVGKTFNQLCQYFCDEGDYSEGLLEDLFDDAQPRVLCWVCQKKGFTKGPKSTTVGPTMTTSKTTTEGPRTTTAGPRTTTVGPPTTTPSNTTTTSTRAPTT